MCVRSGECGRRWFGVTGFGCKRQPRLRLRSVVCFHLLHDLRGRLQTWTLCGFSCQMFLMIFIQVIFLWRGRGYRMPAGQQWQVAAVILASEWAVLVGEGLPP